MNYLNRYQVKLDGLYGIIDTTEKKILPIEYSELDDRHKQLYLAKKQDKYGFIKPSGEIVIPFMYDDCYHFWDNTLAPVKLGEKWGLINRENVLVVDTIYDDMFSFQKEILRVRLNEKTGFLNKQGDIFIDLKYDDADAITLIQFGGRAGAVLMLSNAIGLDFSARAFSDTWSNGGSVSGFNLMAGVGFTSFLY